MKFLVETTCDVNITENNDSNKGKQLYLEGITLQAEIINGNKRIYPKSVLRDSIQTYAKKFLNNDRAVGELDHPEVNSHKINPDRISHRFVDVREEGCNYITKALILETVCGKQVKNLIEGGVRIGMSSRGFGQVKRRDDGVAVIENLHLVTLADIVIDPSAPDAFSQAVYENQEWVFENGVFVKQDVEPIIDKTKKILENSTKEQRTGALVSVFKDYLEKIKK